ncbi:hypothetical protein [Streptomyces sp. NPDC093105]|uniref:hypothetical protein n=1 Tax=Streptomyces sp. NPDC093105 TaxID=3366029 RepID=UPI00380034CE
MAGFAAAAALGGGPVLGLPATPWLPMALSRRACLFTAIPFAVAAAIMTAPERPAPSPRRPSGSGDRFKAALMWGA